MIIDEVVPGLYYAADSAGKMSVAERRTPYEPPRRRRRAMRLLRRGRRGRRGSTGGPPMRRRSSASEGRFGEAEPEGCASIRVVGPYRVEG